MSAILRTALALLCLASGAFASATPFSEARVAVPADLGSEASAAFKAEAKRAGTAAMVWLVSASVLATYSVMGFTGARSPEGSLKYFAAIGAGIAALGTVTEMARIVGVNGLRARLDGDLASDVPPSPGMRNSTGAAAGKELKSIHESLKANAGGALRTGCVLPVLLAGIAVYGLTSSNPAGLDLAGVCIAGGLGIGGPSMLYYLGISGDLERMDSLMRRWNEIFQDEKKEGVDK